jgi:hypothetical protein
MACVSIADVLCFVALTDDNAVTSQVAVTRLSLGMNSYSEDGRAFSR